MLSFHVRCCEAERSDIAPAKKGVPDLSEGRENMANRCYGITPALLGYVQWMSVQLQLELICRLL